MTVLIRTQVIFNRQAGLPEDRVVNTFWNTSSGTVLTDVGNIQENIATFFQSISANIFTNNTLTTAWTLKSYNMADPEPRVPVLETAATFTLGSSAGLPGEVAICLSYAAAPASGVSAARRRGRIYLGPLSSAVVGSTAAGDVRPVASILTVIRTAARVMALAQAADATPWVVWSPTAGLASPIAEVSTDDAFDTQRRRGSAPTARIRLAV